MEPATRVQIFNVTDYVLLWANALRGGMNPSLLTLAMDK